VRHKHDNNLITKISKTINTPWKMTYFLHKNAQKAQKKPHQTISREREGGRTVGSGRVATIVE
jgi:hypothetical protein